MLHKIRGFFIANITSAWRLWSIRFNAIGLLLLGWVSFDPTSVLWVWNMMPPQVRSVLPSHAMTVVGAILFGLSMLSRVVKQPKLEQPK